MDSKEKGLVDINLDEMEFTIPLEGISYVEKEIEKLNKRAQRLKLKPMKLVQIGVEERSVRVKYDNEAHGNMERDSNGYVEIPIKLVTLRIEGDPPKLPGYKLISRLDWKEGDPLIAEVPGEKTPIEYRTVKQGCNHCNKKGNRNDTFILQNTQTNDYIQVGRTCLADFLGHNDKARDVVNSMSFYKTVRDWLNSLHSEFANFGPEDPDDPSTMRGKKRAALAWHMATFFPLVVMLAEKYGYRSAAYAKEKPGSLSTAEMAASIIDTANSYGGGKDAVAARRKAVEILKQVNDKHRDLAKKMIDKVIKTYEKDPNGASTYLFNLYNIAKRAWTLSLPTRPRVSPRPSISSTCAKWSVKIRPRSARRKKRKPKIQSTSAK
jgi:hypothetical protein